MTHSLHPRLGAVRLFTAALLGLALAGCGQREDVPKTVSDTSSPDSVAQIPESKFRAMKDTSFIHAWDLELHAPVTTSWLSPNVPDLVFFETANDNSITAVDAMSGATRWVTIPLPRPIKLKPYVARTILRTQTGQTYNDDRLYVISDDVLFCFDIGSGQVIWRDLLPFSPSTGPLAIGTEGNLRVYIGDWQGRLQVTTVHPDGGFAYQAWQWNLQTDLSANPVERENLVYVGDHAGVMHCFGLDRDQKWTYPTGALINGSAVARERVLYFGTTDNVVFALNRLTGEKFGQLNLNGPINREPFYFTGEPKRVYTWVNSDDPHVGGIYAISAIPDVISFNDNSQDHPHPPMEIVRMAPDWHFPGVSRLVGSTPQHLFMTFPNSTVVLAVSRQTGLLEWAWDAAEERSGHNAPRVNLITEYQDPTDLNRSIFTCDEKGGVIAYRYFGYVPPAEGAPTEAAPDQAPSKAKAKTPKAAKGDQPDAAAPAPDAAAPAAEKPADAKAKTDKPADDKAKSDK